MAILTANGSGHISGTFVIPNNVLSGTKLVEFIGSGGSEGDAEYRGSTTTIIQQIATQPQPRQVSHQRSDPLAQTFMLSSAELVNGIDLWLTAKGSSDVVVEIRNTIAGVPGQEVIARASLSPSSITVTGGAHTRFTFDRPVLLPNDEEMAIVVMCDDAVAALSIATLGQYDTTAGRFIASQPYQVGVLLSSSNLSTWTPHQISDMAFRLLKPAFTETSKTVSLGSVSVTGISDIMVLADIYLPGAQTQCNFTLTLVGTGEAIICAAYQPVALSSLYTGTVNIVANMEGTSTLAPVLGENVRISTGVIDTSGIYVTRLFDMNSATEANVIIDAFVPGSATIAAHIRTSADTVWTPVPLISTKAIDDGFTEITYKITGLSELTTRIKLTLTGGTAARPRVRNLRVAMV